MTLTLRFQGSGPIPGGLDEIALRNGVLTIGRGPENDLVLPDPDRVISKRHCVLEERGGDYVLIDTSTNGTFLNFTPQPVGEAPAPLTDGDVIRLGDYELAVSITGAAGGRAEDPAANLPPPLAPEPLFSAAPPGLPAESKEPGLAGEDDFSLDDIVGSPSGRASSAKEARPVMPADPLGDEPLMPDEDDPFAPAGDGFTGASVADHSDAAHDFFAAPVTKGALIPDDWDEEFGGAPVGQPLPCPPPARDPGPERDPFAMPAHGAEPADPGDPPLPAQAEDRPVASPAPPAPPSAAAPSAGEDRAARAFVAAVGADRLNVPDEELDQIMARMGRVMRAMIEGMREVLMTRASIKSEFRMTQTTISAGGNNPLKFSISPEQAVEAMIRPGVPGYLDAEAATAEALDDIRAHEIAMMTGMEAALKGLLARLDPENLTRKIESRGRFGGFLSGGRKARYWEVYEKLYAEIAREAEDDFHRVFGREFARAYEEQQSKLQGARRHRPE